MPSGSSACLIRRFSSIASGPSWPANQGRFSRPTPCSPVIVPPRLTARSMISPNAFLARCAIAVSVGSYTISGWVLPSPACAITEIITSHSLAMAATPLTRSPSAGNGTPTSSRSSVPLASTAGIANRRAATNASPSSGSSVENTSVAPCSLNTFAMTSASSLAERPAFVGTGDEKRRGVTVQTHLQFVLHGVDRDSVHEFEHRGAHATRDPQHGVGGGLNCREAGDHGARAVLLWAAAGA